MVEQVQQSRDGQNINVTVNMTAPVYVLPEKRINKHVFVWVYNALFGLLGVDRFARGQAGLGILKLVTIGGFCAWYFVDLVIALEKAYGNGAYKTEDEIVFVGGKYAA